MEKEKILTNSLETFKIGIGPFTITKSTKIRNILYIAHNTNDIKLLIHEGGIIIGDDTISVEPPKSGALMIESKKSGLIVPRLTKSQIRSMENPIPGTIVFNITDDKFIGYTELSDWRDLSL